MEIFAAVALIIVGLAVGFLGLKLFRVMLPVAGLFVGAIAGFTGIQGIFGTGVTSTTIAILVACILGLVLALLSYAFFDIAVTVLVGAGMSSIFTILGIALGLTEQGFVMGLLSLSGFIIGLYIALLSPFLSANVVSLATSFAGMGFVLAGIFLIGSSVSVDELGANGVITTVSTRVDQSFWWLFVWIAGIIIMSRTQMNRFFEGIFPEHLGFNETK